MGLDSPGARLRWSRKQHGQYAKPTDAANAFGWKVSTYLGHENGDRNPSRAAAKRYARAYRVRWEWLLENEGAPAARPAVKLVGYLEGGSKVYFYEKSKIRELSELPPTHSATTAALEMLGEAMRGVADNGWLFFFDDNKAPLSPDMIGKLCVIGLKNGDVVIRVPQPGRKRHRFDLESANEATLRDQAVVWAARVNWIQPR